MKKKLKVSCIQYTSLENENKTLKKIIPLIKLSASKGSELITLPECSTFINENINDTYRLSTYENSSKTLLEIKNIAQELGVYISIGSLQIKTSQLKNKMFNRSFLINPSGDIIARYDKIHMFRTCFPNRKNFNEELNYERGKIATISKIKNNIKIGLSICYDLRFPNLYQDLAKSGADIILIPSAFTKYTGKSHWHTLLKARAIETGCFIIAPAQVGKHFKGRESYGHSLIVSPWGNILADGKNRECEITKELDLEKITEFRNFFPDILKKQKYKIKI